MLAHQHTSLSKNWAWHVPASPWKNSRKAAKWLLSTWVLNSSSFAKTIVPYGRYKSPLWHLSNTLQSLDDGISFKLNHTVVMLCLFWVVWLKCYSPSWSCFLSRFNHYYVGFFLLLFFFFVFFFMIYMSTKNYTYHNIDLPWFPFSLSKDFNKYVFYVLTSSNHNNSLFFSLIKKLKVLTLP